MRSTLRAIWLFVPGPFFERKKTRQPHFEFAAFISIRVLDAGFGRDSQFCLESLPAESNGLSEVRLQC